MSEESLLAAVANAAKPGYAELTVASLRDNRPDLITAIEVAHNIAPQLAAATKAERDRVIAIQAAAFTGQEALATSLIAEGKTVGEAAVALNADYKAKGAHLDAIARMDGKVSGVRPSPIAGVEPAPKAESAMSDDELKAKYESSAELKAEFGSLGAYLGYVKGTASGRVRILAQNAAAARPK